MEVSGPLWEFYRILGAVLAANLLTGSFFWGLMGYSRSEKNGTEHEDGNNTYIIAMLLPFFFLAMSFVPIVLLQ